MRSRRFSFLAGWTAVILLALAGFAAFASPDGTNNNIEYEAASASLGHTTGAYAALTFSLVNTGAELLSATSETTDSGTVAAADGAASAAASTDPSSSGTISSNTSGWLSEVQVRALASDYFKPEDVNTAVRIAWCESRFDPNSVNLKSGAVGLFQHLPQYWATRAENAGFPDAEATDPVASTAAAAWAVYNEGGWDIFACRP